MSIPGNIISVVSEICCLVVPSVCGGRVGCACPALRPGSLAGQLLPAGIWNSIEGGNIVLALAAAKKQKLMELKVWVRRWGTEHGQMWWEVDVGGESRHFQVGGSEQIFWFWQGSWVHRLRKSEACWMLGVWLFGKVIIKLAVGSSKYGGNQIMECCLILRILSFVQGQLMELVCLKKAGEMWEWRCKPGIGDWLGKIPFPEG